MRHFDPQFMHDTPKNTDLSLIATVSPKNFNFIYFFTHSHASDPQKTEREQSQEDAAKNKPRVRKILKIKPFSHRTSGDIVNK